jgi:hypothetical protein
MNQRKTVRRATSLSPRIPYRLSSFWSFWVAVGIIITRLDSDDSEDENDKDKQAARKDAAQLNGGYTVSPIFLNALNKKIGKGSLDDRLDSIRCSAERKKASATSSSQALILFQPRTLPFPTAPSDGREVDKGEEELVGSVASDNESLVDEPMDVELI